MTDNVEYDVHNSDPAIRAQALLERGIAAIQAGDHQAGRADLDQAESVATEAGITSTAIAAHINRGWAQWVTGNTEGSILFYTEAADMAREADDRPRLRSALRNLGAALRQAGRPQEAAEAYEEYVVYADDDPAAAIEGHLDGGLSFVEVGEYEAAGVHFEEAERRVREAGLKHLLPLVRMNQGFLYERRGETKVALSHYQEALDVATKIKSDAHIATATITLAHAHNRAGNYDEADGYFAEAEDLFRVSGEQGRLADALYWHALSLRTSGLTERALYKWREEEPVRREMGDDAGLGDCLFEQALLQRDREEHREVNMLYVEAAEAYARADAKRALASVRHSHAGWLREQRRDEEALQRVTQSVELATAEKDWAIESQARGLHALMLADAGDLAGSSDELAAAEKAALNIGSNSLATVVHARRAYLFALRGEPVDEVVIQLGQAYQYATTFATADAGLQATGDVIDEIIARAPDEYHEPVKQVRRRLRTMAAEGITTFGDDAEESELPPAPGMAEPSAEAGDADDGLDPEPAESADSSEPAE